MLQKGRTKVEWARWRHIFDGFNTGPYNSDLTPLAQCASFATGHKLEVKIVSLVSVHCHAHRLALASYNTVTDFYSMVYETAKVLPCDFGSVLLFHRCDRLAWRCIMHQTTMKTNSRYSCSAHAKQGSCRVRQQWELRVRFWLFGPHWSSRQKM